MQPIVLVVLFLLFHLQKFEEHCLVLEANIATVQQRISNEDDDGWMDDDQDGDEHRNVRNCGWFLFSFLNIRFFFLLLFRIRVVTVRLILLMWRVRNAQGRLRRMHRKKPEHQGCQTVNVVVVGLVKIVETWKMVSDDDCIWKLQCTPRIYLVVCHNCMPYIFCTFFTHSKKKKHLI